MYVTPIYNGEGPSRMTVALVLLESRPDGSDPTTWLEPARDEEYVAADQRI